MFKNKPNPFIAVIIAAICFSFYASSCRTRHGIDGMPANTALDHAEGHRKESWMANWRGRTYGVWYDDGEMKNHIRRVDSIVKIIRDSVKSPLPGYKVESGIVFGRGKKDALEGGSKEPKGLMTMFLPVLVKKDNERHTIDFLQAWKKRRSDEKPSWEKNNPDTAYTYRSIYNKYFSIFKSAVVPKAKRDSCPGCIVFDEGHLFP